MSAEDAKPKTRSIANLDRRTLMIGAGATATLAGGMILGAPLLKQMSSARAKVFIARNQKYTSNLAKVIEDGLIATGLDLAALAGKKVLLKPNMVEPIKASPHMTTHPAMIIAAAEVLLKAKATVVVGEAPGHLRDTQHALEESGIGHALRSEKLTFGDLNYQEVKFMPNKGKACKLDGFFFPKDVVEADLIVSMPKMKTHHWVGVTAAMKNLYGTIPGIKYGWPKNVLHHNGIPNTVFDINASLPTAIAIVDAIECMEGDGPIMGTPKQMGLVVIGTTPTAVDATCCRLMHVEPGNIPYLRLAADKLGTINDRRIDQVGENWRPVSQAFQILDVPHLRNLRIDRGVLVS
jgi:uncharacterized protein (DUF362 family)